MVLTDGLQPQLFMIFVFVEKPIKIPKNQIISLVSKLFIAMPIYFSFCLSIVMTFYPSLNKHLTFSKQPELCMLALFCCLSFYRRTHTIISKRFQNETAS